MDKTQKQDILSKYYFDVKKPASFLGASKLYTVLTRNVWIIKIYTLYKSKPDTNTKHLEYRCLA